jgi:hypothetical protein
VSSDCDMVMAGEGGAPLPRLLGEAGPKPPSPPEVVWNSSVDSPIMARSRVGGLLWVEPMIAASVLSP